MSSLWTASPKSRKRQRSRLSQTTLTSSLFSRDNDVRKDWNCQKEHQLQLRIYTRARYALLVWTRTKQRGSLAPLYPWATMAPRWLLTVLLTEYGSVQFGNKHRLLLCLCFNCKNKHRRLLCPCVCFNCKNTHRHILCLCVCLNCKE